MGGGSVEGQGQGPLVLRAATKADLDAITRIIVAGFPDDPGCDYKFPYRHQYPDDFWYWTRLEYEEYLDQPAKFASLVVTAPVTQDDGDEVSHVPIAVGIWDIAPETKSIGGGTPSFFFSPSLSFPLPVCTPRYLLTLPKRSWHSSTARCKPCAHAGVRRGHVTWLERVFRRIWKHPV